MGNFNSKYQEDENCLRIEDLPVEIMVEIFSYLDTNEKMKVSMVNKRWFGIVNKERILRILTKVSEYLDTLGIEEITKVFVLNKSREHMFDIPK